MSVNVNIFHYKSLESTNKTAVELQPWTHLDTIVADTQTAGKGRFDRQFYAADGGLYMSVIIDPARIKIKLQHCTAAAALAVIESLTPVGIQGLKLKWVNDILLDGKKICGILTGCNFLAAKPQKIVIGIGININIPEEAFPDEIKNKAGSIEYNGDKIELAKTIAINLDKYISLSKEEVVKRYNDNLSFVGCETTVQDYANNFEKITGKSLGVDEDCYLMLETNDGSIRHIYSGEICDN